jgi:hypothetical protein
VSQLPPLTPKLQPIVLSFDLNMVSQTVPASMRLLSFLPKIFLIEKERKDKKRGQLCNLILPRRAVKLGFSNLQDISSNT